MLCPAARHVRPNHLPSRAERLQCVQIRSLRASQRSPPVFVKKVAFLCCISKNCIDRYTDINQNCSLLQGKRERRPIDKSRKGEVSFETGADCQNQGAWSYYRLSDIIIIYVSSFDDYDLRCCLLSGRATILQA